MRRPLLGGEEAALYNPERGSLTWWRGDVGESVIGYWVLVVRSLEARQRCRPRASLTALTDGLGVPSYMGPVLQELVEARHLIERLRRYEDVYGITWHVQPVLRALREGALARELDRAYSWGLVYLPETQEAVRSYETTQPPRSR